MANRPQENSLRLEQFDTVLYNSNLNPYGVPDSVTKAIAENADRVCRYPNDYSKELHQAIAKYCGCREDNIICGNGSADMLHKIVNVLNPSKAMLLSPSAYIYGKVLDDHNCETTYFELNEEDEFEFDLAAFVGSLDSSIDLMIIGNPNNPTSKLISRDDIETLAAVCKELDIFLVIDEIYIEFVRKYKDVTSIPLIEEYDNIAVLRSTSKFFAVPGLRVSYILTSSRLLIDKSKLIHSEDCISTISAIATIAMLKDNFYIMESESQIYTERSLIVSAMTPNKNIRLYKPSANFMLARILKDGVNASDIAEHCNLKGIVIRNCSNIHGLDDKYIRFCFMKPSQNDLLVNTILELL